MSSDAVSAFGALLLRCRDRRAGAELLAAYAAGNDSTARLMRALGIPVDLAQGLRAFLSSSLAASPHLPDLAVAWCDGRDSAASKTSWFPVVTLPNDLRDGYTHLTAETLVGLILIARTHVRVFGAFLDVGGMHLLAEPLALATARGVEVDVGVRAGGARAGSIETLWDRVASSGRHEHLTIFEVAVGDTYPHLKLLVADELSAYLGSANVTESALTTNIEAGVVVEGDGVRQLVKLFEALRSAGAPVQLHG